MTVPPSLRPIPDPAADERLASLLQQMSCGDRTAFGETYDRLAPPLFRIALGRGFDEHTSTGLVEHVLLRVWRDAPRAARREASALAWLLTVVDDALAAPPGGDADP